MGRRARARKDEEVNGQTEQTEDIVRVREEDDVV